MSSQILCYPEFNLHGRIPLTLPKCLSSRHKHFQRCMVSQISSACVQRFQEYIMITGIDMFSAFDTIIKIKLMKILELFLQENEIVIIKILLSNTAIDIKAFRNISNHFDTNMGFLQSYDLSGCLFIIHLEKALCTLRDRVDN